MSQADELKKERANVDAALKGLLESIAEVRVLREQLRQAEAQNRQLAAQVDSLVKENARLREPQVTPSWPPRIVPWGPAPQRERRHPGFDPKWDAPPYHFGCETPPASSVNMNVVP